MPKRCELDLTRYGIRVYGDSQALDVAKAIGSDDGRYLPYSELAVDRFIGMAALNRIVVDLRPQLQRWISNRRKLFRRIREADRAAARDGFYAHQVAFAERVRVFPFQYDASETGTGKTVSALAALRYNDVRKALIVCPNIVKYQWLDAIETWTDLRPIVFTNGSRRQRLEILERFEAAEKAALVLNWEALYPYREVLAELRLDAIVADEFHYARNRKAKRTQALTGTSGGGLRARIQIALSGTPFERSAADLYPFFRWCVPDFFGSYWRFAFWTSNVARSPWADVLEVKGVRDSEILADMTFPYMRRLRLEDLKDLPAEVWKFVPLEMDAAHAKVYRKVAKQLKLENPFYAIAQLRYLTMDPALCEANPYPWSGDTAKVEAVREIVGELSHVVVFGVYKANLRRTLVNPFLWLDGETPEATRREVLKAARRGGRLYMTVQMGSTGIDLPRCPYVVFAELPWSYTQFRQALGRVRRLTSGRVVYIIPYLKGTIEERILAVLRRKEQLSREALRALIERHLAEL